MTNKEELLYQKFREKVYADFTEFKEFALSEDCDKENLYRLAEEICFRENLCFFVVTSDYLETNLTAENCKLLSTRFGNRILKTLYTFWNESDFTDFGCDGLFKMINYFCDRLKSEKNYYDYVKIDRCYSTSYAEAYKQLFSLNSEVNNATDTDT